MNRRNFLRTTGSLSAMAVVSPALAFTKSSEAGHFDPLIIKSIKDRIKPVSTEEYDLRKENARKLMASAKIDAIIMEGGTSLSYFTGASWGRSERLFCMIFPQKGEPLFIAPKFEEGRAKEQTGNAKIFTWNENESPYELIKQVLKDNDLLSAVIGMEETTRYFIIE